MLTKLYGVYINPISNLQKYNLRKIYIYVLTLNVFILYLNINRDIHRGLLFNKLIDAYSFLSNHIVLLIQYRTITY